MIGRYYMMAISTGVFIQALFDGTGTNDISGSFPDTADNGNPWVKEVSWPDTIGLTGFGEAKWVSGGSSAAGVLVDAETSNAVIEYSARHANNSNVADFTCLISVDPTVGLFVDGIAVFIEADTNTLTITQYVAGVPNVIDTQSFNPPDNTLYPVVVTLNETSISVLANSSVTASGTIVVSGFTFHGFALRGSGGTSLSYCGEFKLTGL